MDKLEDKILQYIISGEAARSDAIDKEIIDDPSFDKQEFDLLTKIWNEADKLKEFDEVDLEEAWQNIANETNAASEQRSIGRNIWLIAASVIGMLGLAFYFYLSADPFITHKALTAETLTLPDSSTIDLTEGAEIRFLKPRKFAQADRREIHLSGEGVFDVVTSTKPFQVISSLTSVNVLGTKFRYRAEGNFSESETLEGQVRFATNDGTLEVVLNPGDKATFDGGDSIEVERYEPPPPPPPPVIPTNKISLADLVDIIGDLYPEQAEFAPTVRYRNTVVEINLSNLNLDTLIDRMNESSTIQLEAIKKPYGYQITTLTGTRTGLEADYTYEMYKSGVSPKQ